MTGGPPKPGAAAGTGPMTTVGCSIVGGANACVVPGPPLVVAAGGVSITTGSVSRLAAESINPPGRCGNGRRTRVLEKPSEAPQYFLSGSNAVVRLRTHQQIALEERRDGR